MFFGKYDFNFTKRITVGLLAVLFIRASKTYMSIHNYNRRSVFNFLGGFQSFSAKLGGAFGRVAPDATAFAHRSAQVIANIVEFLPPGAPAASGRVSEAWAPVAALSIGSYGNFPSEVGPHVVAAMYPPATLARLRAAKTVYDPQNRFADNENITPD